MMQRFEKERLKSVANLKKLNERHEARHANGRRRRAATKIQTMCRAFVARTKYVVWLDQKKNCKGRFIDWFGQHYRRNGGMTTRINHDVMDKIAFVSLSPKHKAEIRKAGGRWHKERQQWYFKEGPETDAIIEHLESLHPKQTGRYKKPTLRRQVAVGVSSAWRDFRPEYDARGRRIHKPSAFIPRQHADADKYDEHMKAGFICKKCKYYKEKPLSQTCFGEFDSSIMTDKCKCVSE